MLNRKIDKEEDIENPNEIVLGLTNDYTIVNKTNSPDMMLSYTALMVNHTIRTLLAYEDTLPELPREKRITLVEILEEITDIVHAYNLIDSGMTPEEAADIIGLEGTVHELHKKNTKN